MKFAGYTTELPLELLNKNRNKNINQITINNRIINDKELNKELNRKKSNSEKQEYKDDIQTKIFSLYEGIEPNNIEGPRRSKR